MFPGRFPPGFEADLKVRGLRRLPWAAPWRRPMAAFMYRLRWAEYFAGRPGKVARILAAWYRFRARRLGIFLGLTIPPGTCGPGLHIMHWGALVISDQASFGHNFQVHMGVNIGASNGATPHIGDNVYVGPGAKLREDIKIGANAVVIKNFPANVVIAGVPARIIRHLNPSETDNDGTRMDIDHDKDPLPC